MFWNDPLYKPKNRICPEAWEEFMRAAIIILYLDKQLTPEQKNSPEYREPDIYEVFNRLRQDLLNELPYSVKFMATIDKEIEQEIERERESTRRIGSLPNGN